MNRLFAFVFLAALAAVLSGGFIGSAQAASAAPCQLGVAFTVASGTTAQAGGMVYILVARNTGGASCSSASLSLYYAADESFVSAAPRPTAAGYYWTFGTMAPGAQVDLMLATNRSAPLAAGISPDEACLSANGVADACATAAGAGIAAPVVAPPAPAPVAPVAPASAPVAPTPAAEFGVWEWTSLTQMSGTAQMQQIVNEAAANGFNVIYLTIDDYLTIDALPAGAAKTQQLANYNQLVSEFLSFAAAKNIAVDGKAGWRDWGSPTNQGESADIMSFVANYNAAHAGASAPKFRGVQYDVEPYLLPQYANGGADEATVLTQYLQMVENLVNQDRNLGAQGKGLPLAFDIPQFYDDVIQWTPQITLDGITAYPYNQLLRLMNVLPKSTLLVMAYRNFATGANSTVALAQTEISEADTTNVRVIVGQETGPVTPSYVTFSGTSKSYFEQQVGIVQQTFAPNKSFGGIAVDYLEPFLLLQ